MKTGVVALMCLLLAGLALGAWWQRSPRPGPEGVRGAFLDTDPLGRIAYCQQAGVAELIVLANDVDWRVRSAAFETLDDIEAVERMPLRDTPMVEREAVILGWLDEHRPSLSADLCSIFVQPRHARFGAVMVERCLTCHTGARPAKKFVDTSCVDCHPGIHSDWSGTAHANSLSHLVLPTVDIQTRQPGTYDFGELKGLSCVACHVPSEHTDNTADHADCLATFTTTGCVACHERTGAQWETWTQAPHYRPATWPPGSVEQVRDEAVQSCVDCHMPDGQHLWGARRDVALLQAGVTMKVQPDGGGEASLVLHNLAGHAYPSGGVRRALEVYLRVDGGTEELIATLADDLDASVPTGDHQPALRPNEARVISLPNEAHTVRVRLVYVRNRFVPDGYKAEVHVLDRELSTINAKYAE